METQPNGKKDGAKVANATPERISELSVGMATKMKNSLKQIDEINLQVRLLAFNAQVQAARAGDAGRSFAVVASEMGNLSVKTSTVAEQLATETSADLGELAEISKQLSSDVRGTRLSDLALTNIDLIDRNLYERSCDVRWWATDSSAVEALSLASQESRAYASRRLGVILDAYTVYHDIVLCDLKGRVIANGRPGKFSSSGMDASGFEWFLAAKKTRSGDEFGFQSVHPSPLVNGKHILTYSCGVRAGGLANGSLLGVLGILFNWESLAQTIVKNTPLTPEEKSRTRVCITDKNGMVLADTSDAILRETISFSSRDTLFASGKSFQIVQIGAKKALVAHAFSPGYETYATGWHSLIIQ